MKHYDVAEAFKILKENKITTNIESVRRWLRSGTIKGVEPASRKEGWLIREKDLHAFIRSRLPESIASTLSNATNDVKEQDKEAVRSDMWWELAQKNIFEDFLEVKKSFVRECVEHRGLSQAFEIYVWDIIKKHKRGYATPRIPYLLDAFLFDGKRIKMDPHYESLQEKILFALMEHLRKQKVKQS